MNASGYTPGLVLRVVAPLPMDAGTLEPGTTVAFWREVYSFYDGACAFIFTTPEDYYDGPAGGDESRLRLWTYETPRDAPPLEMWRSLVALDATQQPASRRAAEAWITGWWARKLSRATEDRDGRAG